MGELTVRARLPPPVAASPAGRTPTSRPDATDDQGVTSSRAPHLVRVLLLVTVVTGLVDAVSHGV